MSARALVDIAGRSWRFPAYVVAASFDGAGHCAFALGDGTTRLIAVAAETDADPVRVELHDGACLALAPIAGGGFATGGDDGRVMQVGSDGAATAVVHYPGAWIDNLVTSPGGKLSYSVGKTLYLRDREGAIAAFDHPSTIGGLCFSPDGRRIAVSHYGGVTVRQTTRADASPLTLSWRGSHLAVTWSPDGRYLLTAMQEETIRGWKLPEKTDLHMSGFHVKVKSWAWAAGGRYLITSGVDCLPCWEFRGRNGPMGKEPMVLAERAGHLVTVVTSDPTRPYVAAGYDDGAVIIAELTQGEAAVIRPADGSPVSALAWSSDGMHLALATESGCAGVMPVPRV